MARDYVLPEGYKVKGQAVVFNLEEIYKFVLRWFEHYGWNWAEISYKDVTRSDGAKNVEINWEADKEFDSYIRFKVTVDILVYGAKEVEVDIDNAKVKRLKGLIEFVFSAYLDKEEKRFGKGNIGKNLRRMYEKYIIRAKIEDAEEALYIEIIELVNEIKAFLNLHAVV